MWIQRQGYPATRVLPGGWGTGLKPAYEPIILARIELLYELGTTRAHQSCRCAACRSRASRGIEGFTSPPRQPREHALALGERGFTHTQRVCEHR
jgi:hypothetical protein